MEKIDLRIPIVCFLILVIIGASIAFVMAKNSNPDAENMEATTESCDVLQIPGIEDLDKKNKIPVDYSSTLATITQKPVIVDVIIDDEK